MKKQKRDWVDSSDKWGGLENDSGIKPMPDTTQIQSKRRIKTTIHSKDCENSLMKRIGRKDRFAEESFVDWENTNSRPSFVQQYQKWEGRVIEVYQDFFLARLIDSEGMRMTRIATIKKTLVNKNDWDVFFHAGFEFEWVFKDVITNGTFSRKNEIRYTPVTHYLPDEIEDYVKKSMSDFSYMLKEDD